MLHHAASRRFTKLGFSYTQPIFYSLPFPDIPLYESSLVSIHTKATPSTCLTFGKISFDTNKLEKFLQLFINLDALDDIYKKVKEYVNKVMKQVLSYSKDLNELFDDIDKIVDNTLDEIGLRRNRQLDETGRRRDRQLQNVTMDHEERVIDEIGRRRGRELRAKKGNITMHDAQVVAYQEGLEKFKDLYGEHVHKVWKERNLAKNAAQYIGLSKLELVLKAGFGQSLTLEASKRTGYADSIFDEALHQSQVIPVPYTAGLMSLVASGSIEGSMPCKFNTLYSLSLLVAYH